LYSASSCGWREESAEGRWTAGIGGIPRTFFWSDREWYNKGARVGLIVINYQAFFFASVSCRVAAPCLTTLAVYGGLDLGLNFVDDLPNPLPCLSSLWYSIFVLYILQLVLM